ncbi:MAG: hypothetical protein Q6356_006920 [Candidatus Wukongarchaeota archaeon]|nr:hypothetical protein [Candidatus Wukongarchaeota archaeon]
MNNLKRISGKLSDFEIFRRMMEKHSDTTGIFLKDEALDLEMRKVFTKV